MPQLTITTIEPSKNGPIERTCDTCTQPAIVDAKTILGPWAYLCADCLKGHGTRNPQLITNITAEPITLEL